VVCSSAQEKRSIYDQISAADELKKQQTDLTQRLKAELQFYSVEDIDRKIKASSHLPCRAESSACLPELHLPSTGRHPSVLGPRAPTRLATACLMRSPSGGCPGP
jgi:hypothetical protein